MSISNEALQKVSNVHRYLLPCFSADSMLVGARNRNPSYSSTTANQHCQDANNSQAARYSTSAAHLERARYLTARNQCLRRCWQDVRFSFPNIQHRISPGASKLSQVMLRSFTITSEEHVSKNNWNEVLTRSFPGLSTARFPISRRDWPKKPPTLRRTSKTSERNYTTSKRHIKTVRTISNRFSRVVVGLKNCGIWI